MLCRRLVQDQDQQQLHWQRARLHGESAEAARPAGRTACHYSCGDWQRARLHGESAEATAVLVNCTSNAHASSYGESAEATLPLRLVHVPLKLWPCNRNLATKIFANLAIKTRARATEAVAVQPCH